MPEIRDPVNPCIVRYTVEPDNQDFIKFFWWVYGGAGYAKFDLNRPPLASRLSKDEYQAFTAFYGAEPLRVIWTLEGLWGEWIMLTMRYFKTKDASLKPQRNHCYTRLALCNQLIALGFPYEHVATSDKGLVAMQWYYEQFFMLQWRYNWDNPVYIQGMQNVLNTARDIFTGALSHVPV